MKTLRSSCLGVAYILCLASPFMTGCSRKKGDILVPSLPQAVASFRDSVAVEPTLLSVKIDGIPDANIRIDNTRRIVLVTIPTDVANAVPTVELVTSAGSRISRPGRLPVSPVQFVLGQGYDPFELVYTKDFRIVGNVVYPAGEARISYTVRSIPAGDMALPAAAVADIGQPIYIPVRNYYDSVSTDATIRLTTVRDGRVIEGRGRTQISVNEPTIPAGTVAFTSNQPVPPGEYVVELDKQNANGMSRRLSGGRLTLRPGKPALDIRYNNTVVTERGLITLGGLNIYSTQPIDVELISQQGVRFTLKPVEHAADGSQLRVLLPTDAPNGYYLVRFLQAGQLVNIGRLMLSPDKKAVRILTIGRTDVSLPNEQPLVVDRTNPLSLSLSLTTGKVQLRLVNATDMQKIYTVDLPYTWSSYCFECGRLNISGISLSNIPQGQYLVSVTADDPSTSSNELGALDRLVQLQ